MALTDYRCDDSLARPVLFQGPGEHGGGIFEGVGALLGHDLDYGPAGKERVDAEALADVDGWVGRPVVIAGPAHDPQRLQVDPEIQGRTAIGTILSSRFDAATGERIHRFAVHDPAAVAKIKSGALGELSEAYTPTMREPTAAERADGITGVQTSRRPQSLALVPRARAGRRARTRADGDVMADAPLDTEAGSLDDFHAMLEKMKANKAAMMLLKGWVAENLGKMATDEVAPVDVTADAPMPPEMMAMKADAEAQRLRADKAEAELRRLALGKIKADAAERGLTVGGIDKADPTADDIAAAEKALGLAALAALSKGRADGARRDPLTVPPTGASRTDAAPTKVFIPSA